MSSKPQILLADDNLADVKLALHVLGRRSGREAIKVVRDGEEVLEYLFGTGQYEGASHAAEVRLLLLDIKMPKLNGLQVLERIRENPATQAITVVMLTSSRQDVDIRTAYQLGANSYVQKPVDFESFCTAVEMIQNYWLNVNQTCPAEALGNAA